MTTTKLYFLISYTILNCTDAANLTSLITLQGQITNYSLRKVLRTISDETLLPEITVFQRENKWLMLTTAFQNLSEKWNEKKGKH